MMSLKVIMKYIQSDLHVLKVALCKSLTWHHYYHQLTKTLVPNNQYIIDELKSVQFT